MAAIVSVVSFAGASHATAQSHSAVHAPRATVVAARLEGRLGEILTLRSLGAPVQLADGSFEHRYAVVANVTFAIIAASDTGDDARVVENGVESLASAYRGAPGFHGEIRVRCTAPTPPIVTLEPRRTGGH